MKHVSHNNGGYEVKESVESILKMIKVNVILTKKGILEKIDRCFYRINSKYFNKIIF